jgi:hypothetical protein
MQFMAKAASSLFIKFSSGASVEFIVFHGSIMRSSGTQIWSRTASFQQLEWFELHWLGAQKSLGNLCIEIKDVSALVKVLLALQSLVSISAHGQMHLKTQRASFNLPLRLVESEWAEEVLQEPRLGAPSIILRIPAKSLDPLESILKKRRLDGELSSTGDAIGPWGDLDTVSATVARSGDASDSWDVEFGLESQLPPRLRVLLKVNECRASRPPKADLSGASIRFGAAAFLQSFLRPVKELAASYDATSTSAVIMSIFPDEVVSFGVPWTGFGLGSLLTLVFIPSRSD